MVSTIESCLELLQKSDLLTPEQLAQVRQSASEFSEPKALLRSLVQQELLTRWQANMLLAGVSAFRLGKYKLLDLLGRGGGGSVFVAQHTTMNRRVALKTIPKQLDRDSPLLERFLVEARAIASLDHPNIVHAYSLDNEGDRFYMVLELVEGRDLQRTVEADGPLDYAHAADYIRQAAEGLDHAHSHQMIHCDVKPSNLLVNPQGVVKILDLGMARLTRPNAEPTEASTSTSGSDERMLGTIDYVAPEQAMQSPDLDHRVDIYSLGATLYFLLTGHAPFPGGSLAEKILKHQTAEPRSILEQRPGAPRDLVKICQKMMAKNPADRYQTAAEVASLLAAWRPPKQKVLKAVALDDAKENQDGAFDLAALTANQPLHLAKSGSDKKLVGKSSGAGKKGPAKADTPKPGAEAPSPRPWYRRPIVFWAGGAGLVLLGLVVAVVLMLLKSEPSASESTAAEKSSEKSPAAASPTAASPKAVVPKTRKKQVVADNNLEGLTLPEFPGSGANHKSQPSVKSPLKLPGDGKPGKPVAVASLPATAISKEPPPKPVDTTPPKPNDTKAPKPNDTKAPKPADTKAPKPADTKAPKPADTRAPKPAIKSPLGELPTVFELPANDKTEPIPVGKIFAAPGAPWKLALLGGDAVFKNPRRKLLLQEKDPGPDKLSWQVTFSDANAADEDKERGAATFSRDGESLRFQWLPNADPLAISALRYCALTVQVGDAGKTVGLIKPKVVDALVIDFQKPLAACSVKLAEVPQSKLRLEIVKVEGAKDFDKNFAADKPKPLAPRSRGNLRLSMKTPSINVDFPLMLVVNRTGFDISLKLPAQIVSVYNNLPSQIMLACQSSPADPEAAKKELAKKREEAHGKIGQAKTTKEQVAWTNQYNTCGNLLTLLDFFGGANKTKVHFRVYLDAGDKQQIVLVTTEKEKP